MNNFRKEIPLLFGSGSPVLCSSFATIVEFRINGVCLQKLLLPPGFRWLRQCHD